MTDRSIPGPCRNRWYRGCARDWRRHSRRRWGKPWLTRPSALENVEGALDHAPCGADDVEVGLVGPLRIAQIRHFHHRVDVGVSDVAVRIGGRIGGLVFGSKRGLV